MGSGKDPFRAFICVDLGGLLELDDILSSIRDIRGRIKPVDPNNIHLTLKFLGDIRPDLVDDIVTLMKDSVSDVSPFIMRVHGAGAFPNQARPRVLWIGTSGAEPLLRIAKSLDQRLHRIGFKKEKRDLVTHVTLARIRFTKDSKALRGFFERFKDADLGTVEVGSIMLKRSILGPQGPVYSTVSEVGLSNI